MSKRARMGQLADILLTPDQRDPVTESDLNQKKKTGEPKTVKPVIGKVLETTSGEIQVNRPYGERGDFQKITVTLPGDVRGLLLDESLRRKKQRSCDWPIAAIVREAIAAYLSGKQ